jgi:hypothetical protein
MFVLCMKGCGSPESAESDALENILKHLCSVHTTRKFGIRSYGQKKCMSGLESCGILAIQEDIVKNVDYWCTAFSG